MRQTQQQKILELLRTFGSKGLNSYDADYLYHVKQCPTRVHELKQLGYQIISAHNPDRSVNWILTGERKEVAQPKGPEGMWVFNGNNARFVRTEELEPQQLSL